MGNNNLSLIYAYLTEGSECVEYFFALKMLLIIEIQWQIFLPQKGKLFQSPQDIPFYIKPDCPYRLHDGVDNIILGQLNRNLHVRVNFINKQVIR